VRGTADARVAEGVVLGLAIEPDVGRRVARLVVLQESLAAAARALDAGSGLRFALGLVLDRLAEPDRPLEVAVFALEGSETTVVARAPGRESGDAHPAEVDVVRECIERDGPVHHPALTTAAEVAGGPHQGPAHLLGVRLTVRGRPAGGLVLALRDTVGFREDDRLVLEGLATLAASALGGRRREQEQRELDRLRSDFISRVSHELRTPLTIISGFAGTLAAHDETIEVDQRHEMLDRIITAAVRLEHLVDDVLSLASVEAGTREPAPVLVPVRDVVDLAVHDQGGTGIADVSCPAGLKLCTDPSLARQTLGPVVQNALQHGDRVRIEVGPTPRGVEIRVQDDGPGIPPALGERVFDRFVRGDDRSPGMGLGLAVARSVGTAIGAELTLVPTDAGACFALSLPDLNDASGSMRTGGAERDVRG
jgi:signal transduction histidine kinase